MSKPIVHYKGNAHLIHWFGRVIASLVPVDHPGNETGTIENGYPVTTSTVLSHDKDTGRIETQNTIYEPLDADSKLVTEPVAEEPAAAGV